ncbi:MAG: alpha/beta hydrolase fold domain-containing protein [Bacillota bacterium]
MFLFRKLSIIFLIISTLVFLFSNSSLANDEEDYIVLNDKKLDLKYINMINLEFIKFNNYKDLVRKDIIYKKTENEELELDILYPEVKLDKKYPVVIYLHGGGFIRGDKEEIYSLGPLVEEWHKNGWAVISLNYRLLYGNTMFPDNYNDVKDAIKWVIKNSNKYNFSTEKISVVGHSAGGTLALLSGLRNENISSIVSLSAPTKLYGEETFELRKKIMNVLNTNELNDKVLKEASPINYLTKNSPPLMIIHGTVDNFVPFSQAEIFYEKAKEIGLKTKFVKIDGGGHVLEFSYLPRMPELKTEITYFIEENLE